MKIGDLVRTRSNTCVVTRSNTLGIVYEKINDPKNIVIVVELVEAVANKTRWHFHPEELEVINGGK